MKGIYKLTSPTVKVYIGQSANDCRERRNKYKRLECKKQPRLYSSLKKHGFENHRFEVIHELPDDVNIEVLNRYEVLYADLYEAAGFTLLNTRECGLNGKIHESSRKKMSQAAKGRKPNQETRRKMSEAQKKRPPISEETRRRISEASKKRGMSLEILQKAWAASRKPQTEERRRRTSEATTGKKKSAEHAKRIGDAHRDKTVSEETRRKLSEANKGKKRDPEAVKKTADANRGRKRPDVSKRMVEFNKDRPLITDATRQKQSAAQSKRFALNGVTEETRKKLSEKAKADWALRKKNAILTDHKTSVRNQY